MLTIGIGGAAGEGVKYTGNNIGNLLKDSGFQVYLSLDYPSLIKGGHNFVRLSADKEKVWNDYSKLDILVCLNGETKEIHKNELKEGAWVLEGLKNEEILAKIKEFLSRRQEVGTPTETSEKEKNKTELIEGNIAFAKGLQAAGLDFYMAYPMTPATSILHYLASQQTKEGLKVIQPENEIAVINMALGAVYAGKRVAVGSATGGFALMQEAFSFAGMAELPLVVAVAQRQGPATGVPTRSSQSDLHFVIHAGHGEFPRIVIVPGDPQECFEAGAEALSLAWKFKTPVIVLLDKILCEHMMTSVFDTAVSAEKNENIIFPGTPGQIVKVTSYEHDDDGITVDKPEEIQEAMDKRFAKGEKIKEEMQNKETIKIFGDKESENVVVFFGSTKSPVLEAAKYFEKPVKLLQIVWLEPFDIEKVKKELGEAKNIICVEGNHSGQLASLIREKTGIEVTDKILKYDAMPFDPEKLAQEINSILK